MDDDLASALGRLDAARGELAEARAELLEARDKVHALLDLRSSDRTLGGGIDHALVRALYWEHPEVHVERIARAAGLNRNEVYRHAGKTFDINVRCTDCGHSVPITLTSRTAVSKLTAGRMYALCPTCEARREERRQEAIREWEEGAADEAEAEADWWQRHVSQAALEEAERRGIQLR